MDINITSEEAKAGRVKLSNRTYRSIRPGDIVDFGKGEIQYRKAAGYGTAYDGITRNQAYFDCETRFGNSPLWIARNDKFTIWRKK